jgi:hypothetical protein
MFSLQISSLQCAEIILSKKKTKCINSGQSLHLDSSLRQYGRFGKEIPSECSPINEKEREKIILAQLKKMNVNPCYCDIPKLVIETRNKETLLIEIRTKIAALEAQLYNRLIDFDNIDIKNKREMDDRYALWAKENGLLPPEFQFYYERQLSLAIATTLQNLLHKENFESLRHQAILADDIPTLINVYNTYVSLKNKKEQSPL